MLEILAGAVDVPEGLLYFPRFLSPNEEMALLRQVEMLFRTRNPVHFVLRGRPSKRDMLFFGWDYHQGNPRPAAPLSDCPFLVDLRDHVAGLIEEPSEPFAQAIVTRYPP